jgi:SAM-dependent methyltransferase
MKGLTAIRAQMSLLGIAEGFFQSGILFALLDLNVFERIGEGEKQLELLASELKSPSDRLARLLNAGVVLKLLESPDGSIYRLSPTSRAVLLPSAGEDYLGDWILNLRSFEQAVSRLGDAVAAPLADNPDTAHTREFTLAMHNYASLRGKDLTHYLDTSGCRTLLDLGCGPGTYAFHLAIANPDLKLYLLDNPAVLEVAREVQGRYQISNLVTYVPADAVADEISGQYDLILVSNMLHMLGPEGSRKLIQRLYSGVNPGGSLVIQAQFMRDDRLGERWPLLLDLLMLSMTPAGANHSVAESREWLQGAGFSDVEFRPMSMFNTNSYLRAWRR